MAEARQSLLVQYHGVWAKARADWTKLKLDPAAIIAPWAASPRGEA